VLEPLGAGELLIKVSASGLALPDALLCRGTYPLTPPVSFTPGLEFVGTVVGKGPATTTPVGSRVMGVADFVRGTGSFADICKAVETATYPAERNLPDADAAAFTIAYHTAYCALVRRASIQSGQSMLVHGAAGGTGFAAIQLGKALGMKVFSTAGGEEKNALCRDLGVDRAIDHTREDWVSIVNAETRGRGVDIVFDPVGGEMFEQSINCMAPEAKLLPIGFACGRWGSVSMETVVLKSISIIGALGGGYPREFMLEMHAYLMELYQQGQIRVAIDHEIDFDRIPEGVQWIADRKVRGRVVAIH